MDKEKRLLTWYWKLGCLAARVTAHKPAEHYTNVSTKDSPRPYTAPCRYVTILQMIKLKVQKSRSLPPAPEQRRRRQNRSHAFWERKSNGGFIDRDIYLRPAALISSWEEGGGMEEKKKERGTPYTTSAMRIFTIRDLSVTRSVDFSRADKGRCRFQKNPKIWHPAMTNLNLEENNLSYFKMIK